MANTDPVEWTLYDTNLYTKLAILPTASSHLYLEFQEPGSGEVKIPADSAAAALCTAGRFVSCSYRGGVRGGFFIDNIKIIDADASEGGGRWMSISGRGVLSVLDDVIVWEDGSGATTRVFDGKSKGYILYTLWNEAKVGRSALPGYTTSFTGTQDGNGNDWTDNEFYEIPVGTTLLDVFRMFAKTGDIEYEWFLYHEPPPSVYVAVYNAPGVGTDKSNTVYMRIGTNCEDVTTDERSNDLKNAFLVKYKDGYITIKDDTSITDHRRREKLVNLELAQTISSAQTYSAAQLDDEKDPKRSTSLRLYDGIGKRIFIDYNLGDTITVDKFGVEIEDRILGIQLDFQGDEMARVVLELGTVLYNSDLQAKNDLEWMMKQWGTARDNNLTEINEWLSIGSPNGAVHCLFEYDGTLYVGGRFDAIEGVVSANNIAAYNIATGQWSSLGSGVDDGVFDVVYWNSKICALKASTTDATEGTVVRSWNGSAWSNELNFGASGIIRDLYVDGSYLFAVGRYSIAANEYYYALRWNGSTLTQFGFTTDFDTADQMIKYDDSYYIGTVYNGLMKYSTGPNTFSKVFSSTDYFVEMTESESTNKLIFALYDLSSTDTEGGTAYSWNGSDSDATSLFTFNLQSIGGGAKAWTHSLATRLSDIYTGITFNANGYDQSTLGGIIKYGGGYILDLGAQLLSTRTSNAIALRFVDDRLFAGGHFTSIGGRAIKNLAVHVTTWTSLVDTLSKSGSFNLGAAIHSATEITTPTNNDEFPLWEDTSQALRKVTWANIKSTLNAVFAQLTGATFTGNVTFDEYIIPSSHSDTDAPNNSIYYSSDSSKLVYKDSGGTVNVLY